MPTATLVPLESMSTHGDHSIPSLIYCVCIAYLSRCLNDISEPIACQAPWDVVLHYPAVHERGALAGAAYLRAALALFADLVRAAGGGPVADVGCGSGHVTAHLHELGVDAFGIDLFSAMVDVARSDHPRLRFAVGSMTDLDLADTSVAGLFGFHVGDGSRLKTQGYGGHSEVGPHRLI
ncbi:class I SAM-dependent methyltransferase [Streptomyces murinus]|uniref:class I SAM-dependent methyltransferase n=1 Tax=Streptomyces murinus TaxID=33900 RepID=UPI00372D2B3D